MIQPLRAAHRRAFVALAFVLPALLVAGLGKRHSRLPSTVQGGQVPASAELVRTSGALWQKHSIQTDFYRASDHSGEMRVALYPAQELSEPDLLLYWSAERPTGDSLPATARFLGSFDVSRTFALPLSVDQGGYLVLFSFPHESLFDTAKVEKLP